MGGGLTMFRYEALAAGQLPEACLVNHHTLTVIDLDSRAILAGKIGNQSYHCQLKGHSHITLVPAGVSHQAIWDQPIGLTIFYLHRTLLDQIGAGQLKVNSPTLTPKWQTDDRVLYHLTMALQASLLSNPREPSVSLCDQYLITALVTRLLIDHSAYHLQPLLQFSSDPAHSSLEPILRQVNSLMLIHAGQSLTDTQMRVLTGVLRGQQYGEIAQEYYLSQGHVKGVAAELWQVLSHALGQPIRKANLRTILERQGMMAG
jgi:hypothetical protein